ncbi:MAG: hypothetical protein ACKOW9_06450 [Candidatus Paceibacterota bacterium]
MLRRDLFSGLKLLVTGLLSLLLLRKGFRSFGELLEKRYEEKRVDRARGSAEWVSIEERRMGDSEGKIFLSNNLTWADWERQREIEDELTPRPSWLNLVERVNTLMDISLLREARNAKDRLVRGWDERFTYDLGSSLCSMVADQLVYLADNSHGWPVDDDYPSYEDWARELRLQAVKIRRFNGSVEQEAALNAWHDLSVDNSAKKEDVEAAWLRLREVEDSNHKAANEGMVWVANNLGRLWS